MGKFNKKIVDQHEQIGSTCVPSGVEIILKLEKLVDENYCELQLKNKEKGFGYFNDKVILGLKFKSNFSHTREDDFPINELFCKIEDEIQNNRFILISLPGVEAWHIWVVYEKNKNGEFSAFTKNSGKTIYNHEVKKSIRKIKGTDILTYNYDNKDT